MKYGIAIFPSEEIQDIANSYRKRYDPNYALIPPHITLKEAFTANDETIKDIIAELKQIARDTKPFTIQINKVSSFAPVTNTLYFKIEPIQELTELHQKMHSDIFPGKSEHPFVPHITIAQKLSDGEYADVSGILQMKKVEFEDSIDRFQLLQKSDNSPWNVIETFVFGEENA